MSDSLGHIAELWRYPVKSMRGEALQSLAVDQHGVIGDRYFALKDGTGRLGSGKTTRRFRQIEGLLDFTAVTENGAVIIRFPDGRAMRADDPALNAVLTAACGIEISVESEDQDKIMHRDSAPLHLLTEASIVWLRERLPNVAIDARRFRPNIVIAGVAATGLHEQEWLGRTIAIGDTLIVKAKEATVRCVMTT
ncbi:MAG TPA: MOSC N-terminal beta barrel domain-containing protein, partial [Stellaceae bacterium]|nr:MOSC N-terminal beta barrel domain-containing protein [Stellaceae bacterium]